MDKGDPKSGRSNDQSASEPPQNLLIALNTQEPPERVHDRCPGCKCIPTLAQSALRVRASGGLHSGSGPTARSMALITCAEMVNVGLAASAPGIVEPSTM